MSNVSMDTLSAELNLSPEEIAKAAKRLVKQREYRKTHPSKGSSKKWADLTPEEKERRMSYQKNYTTKRNAELSRLRSIAEEMNISTEELLDLVEQEFLGAENEDGAAS